MRRRGWCSSRVRRCRAAGSDRGGAAFAVGHSILVIAWHLLSNDCDYQDLGGDHFARRNDSEARKRYLIRQLEALGNKVTIEPTAA